MTLTPANCCAEDICIFPMIVAELKFRDIERHTFLAHFVECPDYVTLNDGPEAQIPCSGRLQRGHALFADQHKVRDLEPVAQGLSRDNRR